MSIQTKSGECYVVLKERIDLITLKRWGGDTWVTPANLRPVEEWQLTLYLKHSKKDSCCVPSLILNGDREELKEIMDSLHVGVVQ